MYTPNNYCFQNLSDPEYLFKPAKSIEILKRGKGFLGRENKAKLIFSILIKFKDT